MARFTLAASAILAAVSSVSAQTTLPASTGGLTCGGAAAVLSTPNSFKVGDSFLLEFVGVGSPEWYAIPVDTECDIELSVDNCAAGITDDVTIEVYDACEASGIGGLTLLDSETGNCPENDQGADVSFSDPNAGPKTYYISVAYAGTIPSGSTGFTFTILGNVKGKYGNACGDPHFTRWGQEKRDSFHGECDLVLFHHDEVDGEPVDVHIRTTMKDSYSFISGVAVQHGNEKIEFEHDAVFVNGEKVQDENVVFGEHQISMTEEKKRRFKLMVEGVHLEVWSTKKFMGVSLTGQPDALAGSEGILGEYGTGDMIARDGSLMEDFQNYGFEWQVAPSDPQIFKHAREPQLPYERCRMPSVSAESRRRKLRGQDRKLYEAAVAACQENQIPENMQSCVDDVMFTGELDLAFD